ERKCRRDSLLPVIKEKEYAQARGHVDRDTQLGPRLPGPAEPKTGQPAAPGAIATGLVAELRCADEFAGLAEEAFEGSNCVVERDANADGHQGRDVAQHVKPVPGELSLGHDVKGKR